MGAADGNLQEVLDWLDFGSRAALRRDASCLYPAGSDVPWDRVAIQRDLWERACGVARHGLITPGELWLWAHWYGVADGHRWPKAEIRRRFRVGRDYTDRAIEMVTGKVARTFSDEPVSAAPRIRRPDVEKTDLQEAGAGVIGRAVAEGRRHQAETWVSLHDALRAARAIPATGQVRLASGAGKVKRNLKTTRHADESLSEWYRATIDTAARRLGLMGDHECPCLPLWQPADPDTSSLEQSYRELTALASSRERQAIAKILRGGHHQLMRESADRELVIGFLLCEVAILRDSYNLMALPVLDILEHLVPASDHRKVILARERAHLLEVHHLWPAAELWLRKATARLSDAQTIWPGPDMKLLNAVNISVRRLSVRIDWSIVSGEIPLAAQRSLQAQVRSPLEQLEQNSAALGEWRHLADRHDIQLRLAVKGIERRHGVGTGWADADLLCLEGVDRQVTRLRAPARELAWQTRKLSVLLEAGQHAEFSRAAQRAMPDFERYGPAWPNQIAALRVVLEAAMRRRSKAWARLRHDLHDMTQILPADTDDLLRHHLAIPRPLIVSGTPVF